MSIPGASFLRGFWRLSAIGLVTAAAVIQLILARCGRSLEARVRRRDRTFRLWARRLVRILGWRVEVVGEPPAPGAFLVCNHLSYVDIPILATEVDAIFVARHDVAHWPLIGPICALADTLFIDRTRRSDVLRVNREIERHLATGRSIVVFPEGTSTPGYEVGPFRPSLLEWPSGSGPGAAAAAIEYRTPPEAPPAFLCVGWWGDMPFMSHAWSLLGLSGVEATLRFDARTVRADHRKELARALEDRVRSLYRPIVTEERVHEILERPAN